MLAWALTGLVVVAADAEQASEPDSPAAGLVDAGGLHSCAVVASGSVRCWGYGGNGQLGYGDLSNVGDDETPASVGPVDLGGHAVQQVAAGDYHTCAILDDGSVRCWGYGADGRLGSGNTNDVLDPGLAGAVSLGPGRTAKAITAGSAHTCAILDDHSVRCWGFGGAGHQFGDGRLGYGNTSNVGDTPASTPGAAGPVNLGYGRTAVAISAGGDHTCAILDDHSVRCWGFGFYGALGYGNTMDIGGVYADSSTETIVTTTPDMAGPVDLGSGRTAIAISSGSDYTCVILDTHQVECWGSGAYGQLGYGNTNNVGNTPATIPADIGTVTLGPGRSALAITAGADHTCAILDDHTVRCWGQATFGRLGYPTLDDLGNQSSILDPSTVGAVDLGPGRTALAISAGLDHTCALLDDGSVRCWGHGTDGQLGYCNTNSVGETDTPGSVGPVNLTPGDGGATCPGSGGLPAGSSASPGSSGASTTGTGLADALRLQALRARAFQGCLNHANRQPRRKRRAAARKACVHLWGRTPGPVSGLQASDAGETAIALFFNAPGTDGNQPPPARGYLIKQSRHPIRTARDFRRAQTLCDGDCVFPLNNVGDPILIIITNLLRHTTYYYAIRPRDKVTDRCGPRSQTVKATTGPPPAGSGSHSIPPLPSHHAASCEALG